PPSRRARTSLPPLPLTLLRRRLRRGVGWHPFECPHGTPEPRSVSPRRAILRSAEAPSPGPSLPHRETSATHLSRRFLAESSDERRSSRGPSTDSQDRSLRRARRRDAGGGRLDKASGRSR